MIDKIAALGVPGLVLVVAMALTGFTGAAAITTGLAALGGPLGMLGGIALLVILGLIGRALTQYGFEAIFKGVLDRLKANGMANDEIKTTVEGYWFVSSELKRKLNDYVEMWGSAT